MVASVGDDADGMELIRGLRCEGVDTSRVQIMSRASTGLALICVQASGENSIVVVPGTNFLLASAHVRESIHGLLAVGEGGIVVLQAEIEPNVIAEAVRIAHDAGARIVLNLAPFRKLDDDVIVNSDPLVLNENEASQCVGFVVDSVASAQAALAELRLRVRSAVVTIGALGACWQDGERGGYVPATRVEGVVDTTGAGDAFVGALTAELARGQGLEQAVRVGVAAGTFAVQRLGAQSSYPTPSDLGYT